MSASHAPLLQVAKLDRALSLEALGSLPADDLLRHLQGRRWFGAKASRPAVRFEDAIPLFSKRFATARVRAESGTGRSTYQLLLALETGAAAPEDALARVTAPEGSGWIADASQDEEFRAELAAAFACGGRAFGDARSRWVVEPLGEEGRRVVAAKMPSRALGAEQSNTSILFGDRAILKLYRRLEPGEQPDAEIGAFLARRRFAHVPPLYGVIRFEDAGRPATIAGLLQWLVPGALDGWSHALAGMKSEGERAGALFAPSAEELGAITRGLHQALASEPSDPAFAPEPIGAAEVHGWIESAREQVAAALALAEATEDRGSLSAAEVSSCREAAAAAARRLDALAAISAERLGARIRIHGDFHLGQVLRSSDGTYWITDFEGEPMRSLAERRRKQSAIRDVAGMLRSFSYAWRVHEREAGSSVCGGAWEASARAAFLRGYGAARPASFLPANPRAFDDLLQLFEIQKAFYEVAYELENRPQWASIPLAAIRQRLAADRPAAEAE